MFHVLKFIYTDSYSLHHITYVVLDESEYQMFFGNKNNFTDSHTEYTFVCDDVLPESTQESRDLINDAKLYSIILNWLGSSCYEITWIETMMYPYCTSTCLTSTKENRENKRVTLTPAQYEKFKANGGEHYSFSLVNNHTTCSDGHSCFVMWVFVEARASCAFSDSIDMSQAVLVWLNSHSK